LKNKTQNASLQVDDLIGIDFHHHVKLRKMKPEEKKEIMQRESMR